MNSIVSGFGRVAILGTGLMGGSLAASLRERLPAVERVAYGIEPDLSRAMALGLFDRRAEGVAEAVAGADLVVLAAPISVNCALLPEVLAHLPADALLTELSSVKAPVVRALHEALGNPGGQPDPVLARFVASHPIAGSERAGPDAARPGLFEGRSLILSPLPASADDSCRRLHALWSALGARVEQMSVEDHDRIFALVSHWPHAVAFAVAAAVAADEGQPGAARHAGPGLLDLTRIAASSPALWADILLSNREPSLAAAAAVDQQLQAIRRALQSGDRAQLQALFGQGADWRRQYG